MSLLGIIDRPIAFQRSFVRLGIGVTGALMLSQATYWAFRTKDPAGWFYKDQAEWEAETGLTRREQETARKRLSAAGFIEEAKRGVPCRLFYRVNLDALERALNELSDPRQTRMAESAKQDCTNAPSKVAQTRQSITEITTEITSENLKTLCATDSGEPMTRHENQNAESESDPTDEYTTVKGRKLTGEHLANFEEFWQTYGYRKDKARAADAWLQIAWHKKTEPRAAELNRELFVMIIAGAAIERAQREFKVQANQTPMYAEGWLSRRRWEDEEPDLVAQRLALREEFAAVADPNPKTNRERMRAKIRDVMNTNW